MVFGLAFSLIAWRLVSIQAFENHGYEEVSADSLLPRTIPGVRGSILASDGDELAFTEVLPQIYADPTEVVDAPAEAVALARILKISAFKLQDELTEKTTSVVLKAVATQSEVKAVSKLGFYGVSIGVDYDPARFYPDRSLAAPIIGELNAANDGVAGLEQNYNSLLQGESGEIVEQKDPQGQPIAGTITKDVPAVNGQDILTTINPALQYQAEQLLGPAITKAKAKDGVILVEDTKTGDILASANMVAGPHGAVQAQSALSFTQDYQPGSVGKIFTISAALARHKITPASKLSIPNDYYVAGTSFSDDNGEAAGTQLTPMGILAQSSDVGAIRVAQRLGPNEQYAYLKDFGFTAKTDIDFPGEVRGLVRTPGNYSGTTLPTVAFGDGYAVTAAETISAVNAVANGGVYVPPKLVTATVNASGTEHLLPTPKPHRILPARVAAEMTPMLEQVVSSGTGTSAAIPGYAVAGKTGTAVEYLDGVQVQGRYFSSFAGYAPATKPAITVLVVIDNTAQFGATAAAPVFQAVMKDALIDLGIPSAGPQPAPNIKAVPIIDGQPETSVLGE